ncbi:MAG: glutamyl-tRNA reductase [Bacteroidota bacterium]
MLLQYKILTVTHRQTNLKDIGAFSLSADNEQSRTIQLNLLKERFGIQEMYYVATCNRVLFVFTLEKTLSKDFVESFFKQVNSNLSSPAIHDNVLTLEGLTAVDHLLRVGGSIDSLVVGERQILGQLREAFDQALERGHIGDSLRLLFQRMVTASKDIYSNTRIGEKPISVASLAVRKMLSCQLKTDSRILLVGAGQTNTLVGKFLIMHGFENVTVFNRSLGKAKSLAETFSAGSAYPLSELPNYQAGFDCIIVCTASQEAVIKAATFELLLNGDSAKGKVIVDLAIPHNTAAEVFSAFPETTYIEIEGLRQLANENRDFRKRELAAAEQRLQEHVDTFPTLFQQRQLEIAMREVPTAIKAVRAKAVNEVFAKDIEQLDDSARAVLEDVLSYMEKKCIGIPMRVAREKLIS